MIFRRIRGRDSNNDDDDDDQSPPLSERGGDGKVAQGEEIVLRGAPHGGGAGDG
jgi:hypothetical protein